MGTTRSTRKPYATRYHKDGTVTLWDVYTQTWRRIAAADVSDQTLATLSDAERTRIARMAAR